MFTIVMLKDHPSRLYLLFFNRTANDSDRFIDKKNSIISKKIILASFAAFILKLRMIPIVINIEFRGV